MKFSSATVALALALTAAPCAAQGIASLLTSVPACATQCGYEAFAASPCFTDQTFTCLCDNLESIQAATGACLQTSGAKCSPEELAQLAQLANVCSTSTTSTTTATSTSTTTATVSESKDAASTTSSAAATPASNATVTTAAPPTFTGGATNVAATIGSVVLMAAVAWVL